MINRRALKATLATAVSAVGIAMAAAAASERGATSTDRGLIIAVACVLALGTHLLPALSRQRAAWALWAACLIGTAWNHTAFFTGASQRAGQARADAVRESGQGQALRDELEQISARPIAMVATDLGAARSRAAAVAVAARCDQAKAACRRAVATSAAASARVDALTEELEQARRAADLRSRVTSDAGVRDAERSAAAQDQVAATLSRLTGLPAELLSTGMSVLSSLIVELLAALLWSEAIGDLAIDADPKSTTKPDRTRKPRGERVIGRAKKAGMASLDAVLRTIRMIRPRDRPAMA